MDEISSIMADAKARWIAQDGLMKLNPDENRLPELGQMLMSVSNDNGILFRVYNAYLAHTQGVFFYDDAVDLSETINRLRREGEPGMFLRNPGRVYDGERIDNYCAIIAGDMLIDSYLSDVRRDLLPHLVGGFAQEICDRGDKTGYNFVVEDPGSFDIKSWRQGSDIAYYQLIAGRFPQLINIFWLAAGFVFQAFQGNYVKGETKYTSENLMAWLRYRALCLRVKYTASGRVNPAIIATAIVLLFGLFWRTMLLVHTAKRGVEWIFELYFQNPEHPNRRLSRGVRI